MNRTPVQSSAVVSIGFEGGVLEVELPSGRIYQAEATWDDYEKFLAAPSKGKAFGALKSTRTFTRVVAEPDGQS
jgi:hypothetical protein